MTKQLISLEDFNKGSALQQWRLQHSGPRLNGIACPQCGAELVDSDPMLTLASNPPQKNVGCPNCDFKGYRHA